MKIGILVYPHCSLWSAVGPMEILLRANKVQRYFYPQKKKHTTFHVEFVASDKHCVKTTYQYPINHHSTIFEKKIYDLVIIPGFDYDPEVVLSQNTESIKWIEYQYHKKAIIATICTGSFLLAKSGIIDGKEATTHWMLANTFKRLFPNIKFCNEKILIEHQQILISGGATSFHNLVIHIIEKYMGRKVSIGVSKLFLIDINKDSQDSYTVLLAQKKHQDTEILKAQHIIEENCSCKISLNDIAEKLSMSKRNLIRRFKKATGDTPFQYIQKVKVEKAKRTLENEKISFEQVVFSVGYEDVNAFRKIFTKYTGVTPSDYKKRYNISYLKPLSV